MLIMTHLLEMEHCGVSLAKRGRGSWVYTNSVRHLLTPLSH